MLIQNASRNSRRAFTLVEVMVAAAITIVMVGLVIQITGEVLKLWNRSMGKLSANAEARMAMELLTGDLEAVLLRNNGLLWLYSDQDELDSVAGYAAQTVTLAMFTSATDRVQYDLSGIKVPGNISAVEYKLVYQSPVSGAPDPERNTFTLHRRLIDPVTTFTSLLGLGNQETFDWRDSAMSVDGRLSLNYSEYLEPAAAEYYLAGNIVDFQLDFYVVDNEGVSRLVPAPVAYGGNAATVGPFPDVAADFKYPIEYVDISLTVISDEGMGILRNLQAGRGGTGYETDEGEQVILQHGEVFKRRVHLQARPF